MKYYNVVLGYLCKGIVLCVPGLFASEKTFEPLWENLRKIDKSTTMVGDLHRAAKKINAFRMMPFLSM